MNRFVTHFKVWSAAFMLIAGVALSVAGFAVAPVGEIHDSGFRRRSRRRDPRQRTMELRSMSDLRG